MKCDRIFERLSSYLDGEMDPKEYAEVRAHLSQCATCRAEYEALKADSDLIRSALEAHAFDEDFSRRIARRLRAEPELRPRRVVAMPTGWKVLCLAAAAALLVAIGFLLYPYREVPSDSTPLTQIARFGGENEAKLLVSRRGENFWLDPGKRSQLCAGDIVGNNSHQSVILDLKDRSRLSLNSKTFVRLDRVDGVYEVNLMGRSGEIFAEVMPQKKGFRVRTPDMTVEVLGTKFNVKVRATGTETTVVEGTVRCTNDRGEAVVLKAGEQATGRRRWNGLRVKKVRALDHILWIPRYAKLHEALKKTGLEEAPAPPARPEPVRPVKPAKPELPVDETLDKPIPVKKK
jgi:ferric-dicitrate binding protein FerR (iron transport regulator)